MGIDVRNTAGRNRIDSSLLLARDVDLRLFHNTICLWLLRRKENPSQGTRRRLRVQLRWFSSPRLAMVNSRDSFLLSWSLPRLEEETCLLSCFRIAAVLSLGIWI